MKKKLLTIVFLLASFCSFSQVNLTSGLMAYYPFTGNANDSSGNNNNPTFNNATLTTDRFGNANKAYLFNGATSYMQIPNSSTLNSATGLSLCAWVKINGFSRDACFANRIIEKGDADGVPGQYALAFQQENACGISTIDTIHQFFTGAGIPVNTYYPQKDNWYFVVYTYDLTTAKMYVNGVLVSSSALANYSFTNSYDLYLGKHKGGVGYPSVFFFNGVMDEVRIYNRAINTSEISALYGTTLTSGLMAYYPFTGNANDSSGNNNNPTFNNATLTTDRFGNANKAYLFNGTTSYMQIPNSSTLNSNTGLSLCAWVKINGFSRDACFANRIIEKGDADGVPGQYALAFQQENACGISTIDTIHQFFTGAGIPVNTYYPQKGNWYFVVYTYDLTTAKMYVNGVLVNSSPLANYSFTNSYDLFLGKHKGGVGYPSVFFFNGIMDEVRIYNRAINVSEIAALYTPASTNPLPVTITDFSGIKKNNDVVLNWNVANEINEDHYEVERSIDGTNFQSAGTTAAIYNNSGGAYQLSDANALTNYKNFNALYYRLKIVSKTGAIEYSNVVTVTLDKNQTGLLINEYPNPFTDKIVISVNSQTNKRLDVRIIDITGKSVYSKSASIQQGSSIIQIENLGKIAKGVYTLQIISNDEITTKKIFKTN
jgi:hypothetical protein